MDKKQPKPHVLTREEAGQLLLACLMYDANGGGQVNGRHRMEVLAEAMERDDKVALAAFALDIHNEIKRFTNGDFNVMRNFCEGPIIVDFIEQASETKFAARAEGIASRLLIIDKLFAGKHLDEIDWKKSAEVVARFKREQYPEMLSMVEKLTNWQRDQGQGRLH